MLFYLRVALLAPGVVLHELAHHLLCILSGVRVRKVVYFRLGNPAGFVVHEEPELYRQLFAVVVGPLLVNSAAAIVLMNLALRRSVGARDLVAWGGVAIMVWLGVSAALQAIPSRADAANLFHASNRHLLRWNLLALLGYPVALAIYLLQLARPLGSEWLYMVLMAYLAYRGFAAMR